MDIKNLKFDEKDAEIIQISNDWASKMQMVCMDLFMTLERLGISEDDSKKFARIMLAEFSEKCIGNEIDLANFVFNFVNNLKKYKPNVN